MRAGCGPSAAGSGPSSGVQPGVGALRRQRQVCPGSWCRWVNQMPVQGRLWRTIRSTPRREAARWEPRERTRPGPEKDTGGLRAAGGEGCGCRGPLGHPEHGHHSPPPARNGGRPGRRLQIGTRTSAPSFGPPRQRMRCLQRWSKQRAERDTSATKPVSVFRARYTVRLNAEPGPLPLPPGLS